MKKFRILILYAEVMGYVLEAINYYQSKYEDTDILIIELDKKKLTPFKFNSINIQYVPKSQFSSYLDFLNFCKLFNPTLMLVSGRRMDPFYYRSSKYFKSKGVYTVTLQDTQYENSFRQLIISIFSRFLYKNAFCGFWGSGFQQSAFAFRLGFTFSEIYDGFYVADETTFKNIYNFKPYRISKTFIYVGRLSQEKNIQKLIDAIDILNLKTCQNNELIIVGDGPLRNSLRFNDNVKLLGFKNASEILDISKEADAFCLPSNYEPWGVVVHEFAQMGFPLLCSNKCGAISSFLIDGYNGFVFDQSSIDSIFEALLKFVSLSDKSIIEMGSNSLTLSKKYTYDSWSATLRSLVFKSLTNKVND